jgi:hypothetical protein
MTDEAPQRKGWDIVALVLVLHVLLMMKLVTLGPRRPAAAGDPMSLWGGLFFVLWGILCVIAARAEDRSILFRFLNWNKQARFVGWVFLAGAVCLLGSYAGIF